MMFLYTLAYSTTYSEQNPFVNKNSIYETKTISGDLICETKTDHNNKNKKGWTWRCLRVEYMYASALNGPCKRHKVCMLRTANNEYSSFSRLFDVCTATVVRVLL